MSAAALPVVGLISPPDWCDPAVHELPALAGGRLRVQQCPLALPGFDYHRFARLGEAPVQAALRSAAAVLGGIGVQLVVQDGTPFAVAGATGEDDARARAEALAAIAEAPVIMNALALIDALRALRAEHPALACTYYDDDWRTGWCRFVRACGFDIAGAQTLVDQGLLASADDSLGYGWNMATELIEAAVHAVARENPRADAVVVTGSGCRTLGLLERLEGIAQRPVIASDTANYWAALRHFGLPLPRSLGSLSQAST